MATKEEEMNKEILQKYNAIMNVTDTVKNAMDMLDDIDTEDFLVTLSMEVKEIYAEIDANVNYLNGEDKFTIMKMFQQISDYVNNCADDTL